MNLSANCISNIGAKYISEALRHNTAKVSIDLSNNKIDEECKKIIENELNQLLNITNIKL